MSRWGVLIALILSTSTLAQQPAAPAAPTTLPATAPTTAPATQPASVPLSRAELTAMYRRDLGQRFREADVNRYLAAHHLIERYFDAKAGDDRKAAVAQLVATEIAPAILGRLTRIRMGWPALEPGAYYVNEQFGAHRVQYFFGVPANYDRTRPYPLVIKLPSAHAFLADPPPDNNRVAGIYTEWVFEELKAHPDAIVLIPMLNFSVLFGPGQDGMNTVMQPMRHLYDRVNLDPARVYMLGHGLSAHATWNLALHYTTYFAAINPLAGGASGDFQRLRVINMRNVLAVAWHDADDKAVPVQASRGIVGALRTQKVDVVYEETKKMGHVPAPDLAERLYQKMRGRVRELHPAEIRLQSNRQETMFNRIDWLQVYQPINPGKDQRLLFNRGAGVLTVYQNTFRAEARLRGQRIDVTAENVETLRLYLNDQMLDLTQPLNIVVNGKPRLEGVVKQDISEMLADQLFLGRGWRYFTAVVDIDVVTRPPVKPFPRPPTQPTTRPATTGPGRIIVGPGARD